MKQRAAILAARTGCRLALFFFLAGNLFAATPFESPAPLTPQNKIDEIVFARLQELNIAPAQLCSDPVFVRRVYLDVTGTLPTAAEAQQFILDRSPDKRRALIDRLLARDEYRRLSGDEMGRFAAHQGRVSHQPLAERRAVLSSLDSRRHPRQQAVRPSSPANCSPPAAAILKCRR